MTTAAQPTSEFAAAHGSETPIELERRVETGESSGLVGAGGVRVLVGDSRKLLCTLPSESVNCCVTSPPYWGLRNYGHSEQIGQEAKPAEYVASLVGVFEEVRRVLREDGTLWLNLGDAYNSTGGHTIGGGKTSCRNGRSNLAAQMEVKGAKVAGLKTKDLIGLPWMVAFALREAGWWLRQDIVWHKSNSMPESVTDRCTKAHEYMFLLSKAGSYHYDHSAIKEPETSGGGERNKRSVWSVPTTPYAEAHFATFPPDLIRPCILAGCPVGGVVLDPFGGSGTTGMVALELGRQAILIELNQDYAKLIDQRTHTTRGFGF